MALDPEAGCFALCTDEGRRVSLPPDYLAHVEHGYAATGHVSQGETVDRTYLLASPGRGGREWAYVAGSRHRIDLRVYAVHHEAEGREEALAAAWERSQATRLALDLAGPARRSPDPARALPPRRGGGRDRGVEL